MIKTILVYIFALTIGNSLGSLLSAFVLLPCAIIARKYRFLKLPVGLFDGISETLVCFFITVPIVSWFDVEVTVWLFLLYFVLDISNSNERLKNPHADKLLEWGWIVGNNIGLIFAIYFFG